MMKPFWIKNVRYLLYSYSNYEEQRRAWTDIDPSLESSYDEYIEMLLDDNDFLEFIEMWKKENRDEETWQEMIIFLDLLQKYDQNVNSNQLDDYEILEDSKWQLVVSQAKRTYDLMYVHTKDIINEDEPLGE